MLLTVVLVLVVLALLGAFPAHQRYGYTGSGGLLMGVVLVLILLYILGFLR